MAGRLAIPYARSVAGALIALALLGCLLVGILFTSMQNRMIEQRDPSRFFVEPGANKLEAMSVGSKADISVHSCDVRFTPENLDDTPRRAPPIGAAEAATRITA